MPAIILTIANFFGISVFRLIAYAAITATVAGGAVAVRQHYINVGWYQHKAKIDKQDAKAVAASKAVEDKTAACSANNYWDVITQGCKTDDTP